MRTGYLIAASLFCAPMVVCAQEVPVSGIVAAAAKDANSKRLRVQQIFISKINENYTDTLASRLILRHQDAVIIEFARELTGFPDLANRAKKFALPNLQAQLNIYTRTQNFPLPEDLQSTRKNEGHALAALINLESERETRKAHNPHAPVNVKQESEEQGQLLELKSQYDTYSKKLESDKLNKYGIDTTEYYKVVAPILNAAILKVKNGVPQPQQKEALDQLFDSLVSSL